MNHFQRYLTEEFAEDYQEGRLSRRDALKLIASVTGSLVVANSILAACIPTSEATPTESPTENISATGTPSTPIEATTTESSPSPSPSAGSGTVMPDDPAVIASEVEFPADDATTLLGYLARPSTGDNAPGVLGNIDPDQFVADFLAGWRYLQGQSFARADRVGMVGFCFGGGVTWRVATQMPELLVAVPFYGPHPPLKDVPNIQAALLAIYGELDGRINAGIPDIEKAMLANNKIFKKLIYPNADHAFHNDTSSRYNAEAARDAWAQTLAWFEQYLRRSEERR